MLYNIGIQHELFPRVSVSGNWFHSDFYNLGVIYNSLQSFADYTPVPSPARSTAAPITMYNVSNAARTRVLNLETNATDRQRSNNAIEFNFSARLPDGAALFGGVSSDKTIQVACDDPSDPNKLLYCDQRGSGIPWLTQFKIAGSLPLPGGITIGAAFQSYQVHPDAGTPSSVGLEHHPDHPLRRRLQGRVHPGRAGRPRHDGRRAQRAAGAAEHHCPIGSNSSTSTSANGFSSRRCGCSRN